MPSDADDLYAAVEQELKRGELLAAYDLAERGLRACPDSVALRYAAVLALARAGAVEQAAARYAALGLDRLEKGDVSPRLEVDVRALAARITKDRAFGARGGTRRTLLRQAARRYLDIFDDTGNYYPGINAATLLLLSGESGSAEEVAARVLRACDRNVAPDARNDYYLQATRAEAAIVLGERATAERALRAAAAIALSATPPHGPDYGALATTRRQLRLVCDERGLDHALLDALTPPTVVHYTGHGIGERFSPAAAAAIAAELAATLAAHRVGFGYGSLASGSDIVIAEALVRRGAELHVILPFARDEFVRLSVAPAGPEWPERFERCLSAAKSLTYATTDAYLGDDNLFTCASRLAMGLALLRAGFLEAPIEQIAIWDGHASASPAGTAVDVALWKSRRLASTIVPPPATADTAPPPRPFAAAAIEVARALRRPRELRAMLFGDVKNFSKLSEAQILSFVDQVLGRFAAVLDRYGADVLHRNTWGDGLYVVMTDVVVAARCALDLQRALHAFTPSDAGLPDDLALRLGGHAGPVFEVTDPITRVRAFMGSHVSKTARIEPVTPAGGVYVSEAFAAELALARTSDLRCEYVGQVQAAKGYGTMRMYDLREDAAPDAPSPAR